MKFGLFQLNGRFQGNNQCEIKQKMSKKNGVKTVKNVKLAMPILMQFSYGDTALIKITLYMRFLIRANKSLNY